MIFLPDLIKWLAVLEVPINGVVPSGVLLSANNLSDVQSISTSRTNLGLPFNFSTYSYLSPTNITSIVSRILLAPAFSTSIINLPDMTADAWTLDRPFSIINTAGNQAPIYYHDGSTLFTTLESYEVIDVICISKGTSNGTFTITNRYFQTTGSITRDINTQLGTTYTLTLEDFVNSIVIFNSASSVIVTVPQSSTAVIPAGRSVPIINLGAGTVTLLKEGSDILNGNTTLITNAAATIVKDISGNPNTYSIIGGTSTITDKITLFIPTVALTTYNACFNIPFAGILTNIGGITSSGTCTINAAIGGVNVIGTSVSVNSSGSNQAIIGNNAFVAGNNIQVIVTANSSGANLSVTLTYTRQI